MSCLVGMLLQCWLTGLVLFPIAICFAQVTVPTITVTMGVDEQPMSIDLPGNEISPQDMVRHRRSVVDFCKGLNIGYSVTRCIHSSLDYVQSYGSDSNEPCHGDIFARCASQVNANPSAFEAPRGRAGPDLAGMQLAGADRRLRRRRLLRSTYTLSPRSLCELNARLHCSTNTTLLIDLNCDDFGPQLGALASTYSYICVSGSRELQAKHSDLFKTVQNEYIVADIQSPSLFSDIRAKSRLWADTTVVTVLARHHLEFMSYDVSLAFLQRLRESRIAYFVASNSVGSVMHNPVRVDPVADYTPLNLQRYPFQLQQTRNKWRERVVSMSAMVEIYNAATDIPSAYPYYYDDLVCAADVSTESKRLLGEGCSNIDTSSPANWALFVHRSQSHDSSQDGQDGALQYIFKHIGSTNKYFVEFGFNGPTYEDDTGSNSNFLYRLGWRGLLLDGGNSNPDINLHATWIEPETIVSVFDLHGVPLELDYLSIDIDSTDLWVFRAIVSSGKYRPRVVTVEYNSNYPLESTLCNVGDGYRWKSDRISGSSLLALKMVGDEFGYSLVDVVTYLDAVFVRTDLLNGSSVPDYSSWAEATSRPVHTPGVRSASDIDTYIVDYAEWSRNGHDFAKAKGEVVRKQIRALNIKV